MSLDSQTTPRIQRIRDRYRKEMPRISIERARLFTERWQESGLLEESPSVRVALAMKNVFDNMTMFLDSDDRIAGTWCETFLGTPIDIERGLFNDIIAIEMSKPSLILFRIKRIARFVWYAIRKNRVLDLVRGNGNKGPVPVELGFKTMAERKVNPFFMDPDDKKVFRRDLHPYWKGRTVAERVESALWEVPLFSRDVKDFMWSMSLTPSRQVIVISPTAAVCTYQGHLIPDFETVLDRGLVAMRDRVRNELASDGDLSNEEKDALRSMEIALDGVITFSARLADRVRQGLDEERDEVQRTIRSRMLSNCEKAPLYPAETFTQAVQAIWTVKCALDLSNPTNVQALGRLDQLLYPYYRKDLEGGLITREEACELLQELLLKVMSHNIRPESNILGNFYLRYEGSEPVTLGGLTPDGADAANELTYVLIEAAEQSRAVTNVVLRVHKDTPQALYLKLAEAYYRGASNISIMNDETNMEALLRLGCTLEDARNYAITGCTDVICPGKTGGLSISGLMLSRLLDTTLRNGDLQTMAGPVKNAGLKTGTADSFTGFEPFMDAFVAQAGYAIQKIVDASNLRDKLFAETLPAPFVSAFISGCLEKRRDVTRGGAVYDISLVNMINSMANVVDSLYVIKKLVFEQKQFSLRMLLEAVDADFDGYDHIYGLIKGLEGRWGNANPEVDELAHFVATRLFAETRKHRAFKDAPWAPVINSMTSHTLDGRLSIATPDGRRASTPYASSCNPYNVEKNGVTSVLRSVAALDFRSVPGCSVNIRLHPSSIGRTQETRNKWAQLTRTYFGLGGPQLQPTVASADMLREAQKDPEAYEGLIVKVGGYSAYFTELGREIQEEVISRTEHCLAN